MVVDLKWPIADPRHLSQYVYDSVSNVFHLPAVNYREFRYMRVNEKRESFFKTILEP